MQRPTFYKESYAKDFVEYRGTFSVANRTALEYFQRHRASFYFKMHPFATIDSLKLTAHNRFPILIAVGNVRNKSIDTIRFNIHCVGASLKQKQNTLQLIVESIDFPRK